MKNTVSTFKEQKVKGDKITMLTAYDYSTAKWISQVLTVFSLEILLAWLCSDTKILCR